MQDTRAGGDRHQPAAFIPQPMTDTENTTTEEQPATNEIVAADEGNAASPAAIADELCDALIAFERIDYNALPVGELRDLLAARDTVKGLCLSYRRHGQGDRTRDPRGSDAETIEDARASTLVEELERRGYDCVLQGDTGNAQATGGGGGR